MARWEVWHDTSDGRFLRALFTVRAHTAPLALATALRHRFDIATNLALILLDKGGVDVPCDGGTPSGVYELSAVHWPSSARKVPTVRSQRHELDTHSSLSHGVARIRSVSQQGSEARALAITDLVTSEQLYLATLRSIQALYLTKEGEEENVTKSAALALLSSEEYGVVFSNLMQIQAKSGEFLRLLEEAVACAVDPSAMQVGESVYFLAQCLPLYSTFAASAAQRARLLSGLLDHGETPFVRYHHQLVEVGHEELTVLLQRPTERMVEYARLLTALLESSGVGGGAKSERKMVTVALKAVVDLNDAIEQSRHRDSLQDMEKKTGVSGLFVPGRAYITKGTLRVVYKPKEAKASRLCTFYLCSDLLLIGVYTHGCFEDPTLLPLNKQERFTVERVLPGTYNYEKIFTKGHVERGAGGALRRMRGSISSAFSKGGSDRAAGADVEAVGVGTSTFALDILSSSSSSTAEGADSKTRSCIKEGYMQVGMPDETWKSMYFAVTQGFLYYFPTKPVHLDVILDGSVAAGGCIAQAGGMSMLDLSHGLTFTAIESQPTDCGAPFALMLEPTRVHAGAHASGAGYTPGHGLLVACADEGDVMAWRQALEQCIECKSVGGQGNQGANGPFVIHHCFKLLTRKRNIYIEAPDPAAFEDLYTHLQWLIHLRDGDLKYEPRPTKWRPSSAVHVRALSGGICSGGRGIASELPAVLS